MAKILDPSYPAEIALTRYVFQKYELRNLAGQYVCDKFQILRIHDFPDTYYTVFTLEVANLLM